MVAEPRSRRRGLGREALEMFIAFSVHALVSVHAAPPVSPPSRAPHSAMHLCNVCGGQQHEL